MKSKKLCESYKNVMIIKIFENKTSTPTKNPHRWMACPYYNFPRPYHLMQCIRQKRYQNNGKYLKSILFLEKETPTTSKTID